MRQKRNGYVLIDGQREHRMIYSKACGKIPKGYVIHHINEIRDDNRLENLVAIPSKLHDHLHRIQRLNNVRYTKEQIERVVKDVEPYLNMLQSRKADLEQELKDLQKDIDLVGIAELTGGILTAPSEYEEREKEKNIDVFVKKTILRKRDDTRDILESGPL